MNVSTSGRLNIVVFVSLILAGIFSAQPARAQSGEGADDFSLFIGYMLPNQIDHVTEIMPVFGGRYAFGLPLGAIELEGTNTHSAGVDFTTIGASLRGEVSLGQGVAGLIYGGPDFHYYSPQGSNARQSDYGIHIGAAGMLLVKDSLWLRADLKFMGNPGTALYLLFGLHLKAPGG